MSVGWPRNFVIAYYYIVSDGIPGGASKLNFGGVRQMLNSSKARRLNSRKRRDAPSSPRPIADVGLATLRDTKLPSCYFPRRVCHGCASGRIMHAPVYAARV